MTYITAELHAKVTEALRRRREVEPYYQPAQWVREALVRYLEAGARYGEPEAAWKVPYRIWRTEVPLVLRLRIEDWLLGHRGQTMSDLIREAVDRQADVDLASLPPGAPGIAGTPQS